MTQPRAVGIDIGSCWVKAVAVQRKGTKLQVTGIGIARLPDNKEQGPVPDTAAMAGAIRAAVEQAGAGSMPALCALPRHAAATRVLRLPPGTPEHLEPAARIEAGRLLPFPAGDAAVGVHLAPTPDGEATIGLAAAARRDTVEAYRTAVAMAGVELVGLGVSSLAAAAAAGRKSHDPYVLLDLGAYATAVEAVVEGCPCTSHVILSGGAQLTQAYAADLGCSEEAAEARKVAQGLDGEPGDGPAVSAWVSHLVTQVRLALAAHTSQGYPEPACIRLAGGGGALHGLAPVLERALGLPVEPLPPGQLETAGAANPGQFLAAYGLALAAGGAVQTADLLAAEVREARATRRRRLQTSVLGVVLAVALGAAGLTGYQAWQGHAAFLKETAALSRTSSQNKEIAKSLGTRQEALATQAKALQAALRPDHAWVDVVNELAALAPKGIWLTGIELERGKPLVIRGTAMLPGQAADFVAALRRAPSLDQVQLTFANDAEVNKRHVTQFGISAVVRGNLPEPRMTATTKRTAPKLKKGTPAPAEKGSLE